LVLRFRRSRGVERQQLKWFTYAALLMIVLLLVTDYLLPQRGGIDVLYGLVIALVPVAAGIAILRYRLYDIDRLINRTLVYGLLTTLLGAVYAAAVLGLGQVRRGGRSAAELGGGRGDPGRGRAVPTGPAPHPSGWLTGVSTGATTTPPRPSRPSAPGSATRSTWTRCRPSCWR
jgi:hypothetical protein